MVSGGARAFGEAPGRRVALTCVVASRVVIRGTRKGASSLRLGLVPTYPDAEVRTANIICPEAHEFWETVKDASSFYAYFDELFPQIAWRETVRHLPGRGAPGRARRDGR